MNNDATNLEQIHKMASGVKLVAFLSLATNVYEIYGFLNTTASFQNIVSIVLGILGTILIWQFARELQGQKKQSMYYWMGILFIGFMRLVSADMSFTFTISTVISLALIGSITGRLTRWTRSKLLI